MVVARLVQGPAVAAMPQFKHFLKPATMAIRMPAVVAILIALMWVRVRLVVMGLIVQKQSFVMMVRPIAADLVILIAQPLV